jgi:hypothetical protein
MSRELTFIVTSAVRTAEEFEALASQANRLKQRGTVAIQVNQLSERTISDIPPGGSPWHDYTSCLGSLEKLFPHHDLEPFVDMEHVRRNQKLLKAKLAVLRRHELSAAVQFHLPWYLPEPFFEKYPHLRGPRIDHPRRSRRDAHAMCVDCAEGAAFYGEMFGQLAREVGELSHVHLSTNDAGGGFCWADWLYAGPNGPEHCRHRDVGQRVRGLIDAFRAAAPGRNISFDLRGNFSELELRAISHYHDEGFIARPQHGATPRHVSIGTHIDNPVLGVFDPVGILGRLDCLRPGEVRRVHIGLSANYARGHELPEVSSMVLELLDAYLAEPAFGLARRITFLRKACAGWVGEEQADTLLDALNDMHEAYAYRAATAPMFSANYAGVSIRHINRPLVAIPELLSPEEEAYWLPHVFNPNINESRTDYIDFHGGRMKAPQGIDQGADPRVLPLFTFGSKINTVADRLQGLAGDGAEVFRRMGTSLRIYASILRSSANFYAVQRVRDRNKAVFAGEPRIPSKEPDWFGNADLQMLNEFMRDELDNTTELIRILEDGGLRQVLTAKGAADEDTFLLGPDLIQQLRDKCRIMRRHWLDAERYLATPHK